MTARGCVGWPPSGCGLAFGSALASPPSSTAVPPLRGLLPFLGPFPGPYAGELAGPLRGTAVNRGLDQRIHRPLQGSGQQDLAPAAPRVGRLGGILLTGSELPNLLEDHPGKHPAEH